MSESNPLFGRKPELIWDGKYDDVRRRVAPLRVALPFQTVETVKETAQERQKSLSLFEGRGRYGAGEWRNRLIWADKKYVLPSLLVDFAAAAPRAVLAFTYFGRSAVCERERVCRYPFPPQHRPALETRSSTSFSSPEHDSFLTCVSKLFDGLLCAF